MSPEARSAGFPRWLDLVLALIGLVVLAPLLLLVAVGVAVSSRGGVLYRQVRVGREGVPFELLKFRSMSRAAAGGPQFTVRGDERVTTLGRWLRRSKLDELPSLVNIARGEMSLVGPRPEVPGYVDLENPRWRAALRVRPGLTHPVTLRLRDEESLLASVEGEVEPFYRSRMVPYKLDGYLQYEKRRSFASDLSTLLKTAAVAFLPGLEPAATIDEVESRTRHRE